MCHLLQYAILLNDLVLTSSQFILQCQIQTTKVGAAHNTIECRKIFIRSIHYLATSKNHMIILTQGAGAYHRRIFADMQKWWRAI